MISSNLELYLLGSADGREQQIRADSVSEHEPEQDFQSSDSNDEDSLLDDDDDDYDIDDVDSDRSSLDEFAGFSWLEQIDTYATEGSERIATCDAKLIRRDQIRSAFWIEMEEPTEETSSLAFDLFDRYGRLKREHYEHSFKRGSGAWGRELDHGDILLIEKISVTLPQRRHGIGTQIVKVTLNKIRPKTNRFVALASPGYLTQEVDEENEDDCKRQLEISELFFRSLGFRRVGISSWFAFVDNPNHPSRHLKASDDWNESADSHIAAFIPEQTGKVFANLSNPDIHGDECVRILQKGMQAETQDASWSAADEEGNNMLHLAAIHCKLEAVQYILSCHQDLASKRNRAGNTPLEALKAKMESVRTRADHGQLTRVRSDKFAGFTQSMITCVSALSDGEVFDLDTLPPEVIDELSSATEDHIKRNPSIEVVLHNLRLRYGCTCGQCIGGFLSPRMHLALLCQAEYQYDLLLNSFSGLQDGPSWVEENDVELNFLPASVKENLKTNKSMREGFINICDHIAKCLKQKKIPNESNVLFIHSNYTREWPPVTKSYLQRGGTVAAVATMLFQKAMEKDECSGDGNHQDVFGDEIERLPDCRNDKEFGFVSGMCGYKRISTVRYVDMLGNLIDTD